jgi:radical SAM protein with 4Fe4S-binding SPASM domain
MSGKNGILHLREDDTRKVIHATAPGGYVYNSILNKVTGQFARWGDTMEQDPTHAPGPEILDLEISYGGHCAGNCAFCYKENGGDQPVKNMTLAEFQTILGKMPPTLGQIAFGIMNISTNPDFFPMMEYAKANGVAPNYTCHGFDVTEEVAKRTAQLCGAVAVSVYDPEKSFNAIKMFTDAGMKQVNIHFMLAEETFDRAFWLIDQARTDTRLSGLNAIVFLAYKPKGRNAGHFHTIKDSAKYAKLLDYAKADPEKGLKNVNWGCDSCSAPAILKTLEAYDPERLKSLQMVIEPCEATCFSSYINADGEFFPCSFTEGQPKWEEGLNVLECGEFIGDIWNHPRVLEFRDALRGTTRGCATCPSQSLCRTCPVYPITGCVSEA